MSKWLRYDRGPDTVKMGKAGSFTKNKAKEVTGGYLANALLNKKTIHFIEVDPPRSSGSEKTEEQGMTIKDEVEVKVKKEKRAKRSK
jgi:hypothetical protein